MLDQEQDEGYVLCTSSILFPYNDAANILCTKYYN